MRGAFAAACLLALAACGEREPARAPATSDAPAPAATTTPPPPQAAPSTPATSAPAAGAMPAPGTIGYGGFGPARFGGTEEEVRMAWGRELGGLKPDQPGGCYYLMPQPRSPDGYRLAFMFEDQRFVRMDVDVADIDAPGGGRVGMTQQDIQRLYGGRVQLQDHKYVEGGHYLRIPDANGPGVLLFETDAAGRVVGWRIGEPPQVDYVEGCS